jgi:hypothetical protein
MSDIYIIKKSINKTDGNRSRDIESSELFDLTLESIRGEGRMREVGRLRELFWDGVEGGK